MGGLSKRKLTKEICEESAKQCKTIEEFRKKDQCAYNKAKKMQWLDQWFTRVYHAPYTKEECFALATQCTTRSEFKKKSYAAWRTALHNGWIDSYEWFKSPYEAKSDATRKYTDDEVIYEARKYNSLSDFRCSAPIMYQIACKRGLLNKMVWLSRKIEACERNYLDAVYVYEFDTHKTAYIGRSIEPHRRDTEHHVETDVVARFAKEINSDIPPMKLIHDGVPIRKGAELEKVEIKNYRERGWTLLNKAPGGSIGSLGAGKLSKAYCLRIASQYNDISDLIKNNGSVYNKLRHNNWLCECSWLKYKHLPKGTWCNKSKDELLDEARKYQTRTDFMHNSKTCYEILRRNKWLDEVFK